jgi:hypothetical protein
MYRLNTDVDDVEIPGLPVMFSNDLILWRDPVRSLLWFLTINLMFYLAVYFNVSLVSMVSFSALLRLFNAFVSCRALEIHNRFLDPESQWDLGAFVHANFIVSTLSLDYFAE